MNECVNPCRVDLYYTGSRVVMLVVVTVSVQVVMLVVVTVSVQVVMLVVVATVCDAMEQW